MADISFGPVLFLILVIIFAVFIYYAIISKRRSHDKRNTLINAYKTAPTKTRNAPILIQGPVPSPDLILPTTGEHVGFYALFILSKESSMTSSESNLSIGSGSIERSHISDMKGFRVFETSGDFSVVSEGTRYEVGISGVLAQFKKGASLFTSPFTGLIASSGIPEKVQNDTMGFQMAQEAYSLIFGFSAPIRAVTSTIGDKWQQTTYITSSVVSATSTVDSRLQSYVTGINLPKGVLEILAKKGIVPTDKEEISVIELFIPLHKEVYVFGTFDGEKSIVFLDSTVKLSVSYQDPGSL